MAVDIDKLLDQFNEREQELIAQNNLYGARVLACVRLRNDGLSLRQIGARLDLSHEMVRRYLLAS